MRLSCRKKLSQSICLFQQTCGLRWLCAEGRLAAFARESAGERSVAVLNAGDEPRTLTLDWPWENCTDLLSGRNFAPVDGELHLALSPYEGLLLG